MKMLNFARVRGSNGFSLVEILIALAMFSVGVLSLASAGFHASRTLHAGKSYMTEWAVAQTKLDSLTAAGWAALDNVSGSETVSGYLVTWQTSGTNPRVINLVVNRTVLARTRADTFITYVAQP